MIYLTIYLLTKLDDVLTLIKVIGIVSGALFLFMWFLVSLSDRVSEAHEKGIRRLAYVCVIAVVSYFLIPDSKSAMIIFAGGQVYEVVTSDTAKEVRSEVFDALRRSLQQHNTQEE